jgi:hypothetical protein
MIKTRDFFLLKDYFTFKQRAGYSLSYARDVYHDPPVDPSLTVPLPPSPLLPDLNSTQVKEELISIDVSLAGDESIPVLKQQYTSPTATIILPPLDTTFQMDTPEANSAKPPDTPSSGTTNLLPIPETETPAVTTGAAPFRCAFCAEPVVTPCWYCMDCYYTTGM